MRINKNGGLFAYVHHNHRIIGIVSMTCETDFAEKTEVFKIFGDHLAMLVACSDVESVEDFLKSGYIFNEDDCSVNDMVDNISKKLKEKIEILEIKKITF
jgi:translation elongation factor EF-Ts